MNEDVKECNSQIIKRYKRFLKDNGIYKRVMSRHLENAKKKCLTLEEFFSGRVKMTLISNSDSFCIWERTPEGKASPHRAKAERRDADCNTAVRSRRY